MIEFAVALRARDESRSPLGPASRRRQKYMLRMHGGSNGASKLSTHLIFWMFLMNFWPYFFHSYPSSGITSCLPLPASTAAAAASSSSSSSLLFVSPPPLPLNASLQFFLVCAKELTLSRTRINRRRREPNLSIRCTMMQKISLALYIYQLADRSARPYRYHELEHPLWYLHVAT